MTIDPSAKCTNRDKRGRFIKGHKIGLRFGNGQKIFITPKGWKSGEENPIWKGDKVQYMALHAWVRRWLGKPKECVYCGESQKRIYWASISHKAKRDLNDYIPLCGKCHFKYDRPNVKLWRFRWRKNTWA